MVSASSTAGLLLVSELVEAEWVRGGEFSSPAGAFLLHTFGVPGWVGPIPRVASRGGAAFLTLGFGV